MPEYHRNSPYHVGSKVVARRKSGGTYKAKVDSIIGYHRVRLQWCKINGTPNDRLPDETVPVENILAILSEDDFRDLHDIYQFAPIPTYQASLQEDYEASVAAWRSSPTRTSTTQTQTNDITNAITTSGNRIMGYFMNTVCQWWMILLGKKARTTSSTITPITMPNHNAPRAAASTHSVSPPAIPHRLPEQPTYKVNREVLSNDWKAWVAAIKSMKQEYRSCLKDWTNNHRKHCEAQVKDLQGQIKQIEQAIISMEVGCSEKIIQLEEAQDKWIEKCDKEIAVGEQAIQDLDQLQTGKCQPSSPVESEGDGEKEPDFTLDATPSHLCCPITLELMRDPVIAMDGHTYERAAIQRVIDQAAARNATSTYTHQRHILSPSTNLPLTSPLLIPNITVRSQCRTWQEENR